MKYFFSIETLTISTDICVEEDGNNTRLGSDWVELSSEETTEGPQQYTIPLTVN